MGETVDDMEEGIVMEEEIIETIEIRETTETTETGETEEIGVVTTTDSMVFIKFPFTYHHYRPKAITKR